MKSILIYISFLFIIYNCYGEPVVMDPDIKNRDVYRRILYFWAHVRIKICTPNPGVKIDKITTHNLTVWKQEELPCHVVEYIALTACNDTFTVSLLKYKIDDNIKIIYFIEDKESGMYSPIPLDLFLYTSVRFAKSFNPVEDPRHPPHLFIQNFMFEVLNHGTDDVNPYEDYFRRR